MVVDGVCSNKENIVLLPELTDSRDDDDDGYCVNTAEIGNKINTPEDTGRSSQKSLNNIPINICNESVKTSLQSTPNLKETTNLTQIEHKNVLNVFQFELF